MEEIIQGKHFSITDPPEVNTVIYQVNKTPKEELKENSPKFTVERLDFTEELVGEKKKKTAKAYKLCFVYSGNGTVCVSVHSNDRQ